MSLTQSMLQSADVSRLGWTLVHSLWEGAAVAALIAIVLIALRRQSSQSRYVSSCLAMSLLLLLPVATFCYLKPAAPMRAGVGLAPSSSSVALATTPNPLKAVPIDQTEQPILRVKVLSAGTVTPPTDLDAAGPSQELPRPRLHAPDILPWLVFIWAVGVAVMSLWNLGGWIALQRLKFIGAKSAPQQLQLQLVALSYKLGLHRTVRILESACVRSPLTIGAFKPIILIPASVVSELPLAHLESIIAHELAHIRRHDYLMNLIQSVVETLLFYHPAIWWISRVIRTERENCCDDIAVQISGDRGIYASALARVAAQRDSRLAMAAATGTLLNRVRRILNLPPSPSQRTGGWAVGVIGLATCLTLASLLVAPRHSAAQEASTLTPEQREVVDRARTAFQTVKWTDDTDLWAAAMRDVIQVGKPAVPDLTAEIIKTDRAFTVVANSIALRNIGDRRAVRALIYALARSRVQTSDYGISISDPELHLAYSRFQMNPHSETTPGILDYGRPARELSAALESLTGHTEGGAQYTTYNADGSRMERALPEGPERERQTIRTVADRWQHWWDKNKASLISKDDLEWADAHSPPQYDAPPASPAGKLHLTLKSADSPATGLQLQVWSDHTRFSVRTNDAGAADLPVPASFERYSILARKAGYVPVMISWNKGEVVPDHFEFALPPAMTIGGTVEDESGKPIAGTNVCLLAPQKLADHVWADLLDISAETNAEGQWRLAVAPENLTAFSVRAQDERYVTDDQYGRTHFTVDDLKASKAKLVVHPTFAIHGTVLDAAGAPLAKARVVALGAGATHADLFTDSHGKFEWHHLRPGKLTICAESPSGAAVVQQLDVGKDLPPIELKLQPGHPIHGTVVDRQRKPVADAVVTVERWNGQKLLNWSTRTDAAGKFTWKTAPAGPLAIGVYRSGFEVEAQAYKDGDLAFTLDPVLRIAGHVVDADSGKPIDHFVFSPGTMFGTPPQRSVFRSKSATGSSGQFTYTFSRSHAPGMRARDGQDRIMQVQADGYLPAISRPVHADEGTQNIEFKLKHHASIVGRAVLADGKPAVGADVLLATPSQTAFVNNGAYADSFRREGMNVATTTDTDGKFEFQPQNERVQVIVLHEKGYAIANEDQLRFAHPIKLDAWGRVEGTLYVDNKPADDKAVQLWIPAAVRPQPSEPRLQLLYGGKTDASGHFTFTRVAAGAYHVGATVPIDGTVFTTTPGVPVDVQPGGTMTVTLGGDAHRDVVGHLAVEGIKEPIDWTKTALKLIPSNLPRNAPRPLPRLIPIGADATFRIENLRTGVWEIGTESSLPPLVQNNESHPRNGRVSLRFEVPGGQDARPYDLGALAMTIYSHLALGQNAPAFDVPSLDGKKLSLDQFKGKYVFVDFWAVWCGPCVAEIPAMKDVYETFKNDDRFVMLSLSLDPDIVTPRSFVKERELAWQQGFLGRWNQQGVAGMYGVEAIPSDFLIDPAGRIIATDLRGPKIKETVQKFLSQRRAIPR